MCEGRRECFKIAVEQFEVVVVHGHRSPIPSGRSGGARRRHRGKGIHVDIQLADLSPPFLRVGSRAEAHCGC